MVNNQTDRDNRDPNQNQGQNRDQNQNYTVLRDAKQGDAGFDAAKGAQSWVRMPDGSEKCVPKA